jgi:hypothetical protein
MHRTTSRDLLGFDSRKRFHQAALTTGGIVLVDDTFLGGLIEAADGGQDGFLRGICITSLDGSAGVANRSAESTAHHAVAQAAFFVLAIAFDLRLNVSQGTSSKKSFQLQRAGILPDIAYVV